MTDCKPIESTRIYKRDQVLGLMVAKEWIPSMESFDELDHCIELAERDLDKHPEIADTLEEFVNQVNYIFVCEWDAGISQWTGMLKEKDEDD